MSAQCDVDRNKYLLLKLFIDHGNNDLAFSTENQKVFVQKKENFRKSTAGGEI